MRKKLKQTERDNDKARQKKEKNKVISREGQVRRNVCWTEEEEEYKRERERK